MTPMWLIAVFMAIMTFYMAELLPREKAKAVDVEADVAAASFVAYRRMAAEYLRTHSGSVTDGSPITDAQLELIKPLGYPLISNVHWANIVQNHMVYVYCKPDPTTSIAYKLPPEAYEKIYEYTGRSPFWGHKNASNKLINYSTGLDTGIAVPAAIPNDACLFVGS